AAARGEEVTYEHFDNVADFLAALPKQYEQHAALLFELANKTEQLTYKTLHQQSEQLALYLQSLGLRPQAPVALCLERGVDMVVALLAVIKAGSPYLP